MVDLSSWVDQYGLLCQKNLSTNALDGGDSPMKTSLYCIGSWLQVPESDRPALSSHYLLALQNIRGSAGKYFRNPVNYTNPSDMSRDQEFPMLCAMSLIGATSLATQLKNSWLSNINRAPNDDLIGPDVWATYFGFVRSWGFYALLVLFGDLDLLIGVIVRCVQARNPDDVGDDMNLCVQLVMRRLGIGSPLSWLARQIYVHCRPWSYGSYFDQNPNIVQPELDSTVINAWGRDANYRHSKTCGRVLGAWRWYFRTTTGAPPLDKVWEPVIKEYLS